MIFYFAFVFALAGIAELFKASSWMQFASGVVILVVALGFYVVTAIAGALSSKFSQPVIHNHLLKLFDQENEPIRTDQ